MEDNGDDDRADGALIPLQVYGCWDAASLTRLQTDAGFITAPQEPRVGGAQVPLEGLTVNPKKTCSDSSSRNFSGTETTWLEKLTQQHAHANPGEK